MCFFVVKSALRTERRCARGRGRGRRRHHHHHDDDDDFDDSEKGRGRRRRNKRRGGAFSFSLFLSSFLSFVRARFCLSHRSGRRDDEDFENVSRLRKGPKSVLASEKRREREREKEGRKTMAKRSQSYTSRSFLFVLLALFPSSKKRRPVRDVCSDFARMGVFSLSLVCV